MMEVYNGRGLKIAVVVLALLTVIVAAVLVVLVATGGGRGQSDSEVSTLRARVNTLEERQDAESSAPGSGGGQTSQSGSQSGSSQQGQSSGSQSSPAPKPETDEEIVRRLAMEYAKAPDDTVNWQVVDTEIVYIPQPAGDPEGWALVTLAVPGSGGDPLMVVFRYWGGIWTNIAGGQPLHHSDVPQAPQELFN